MKRVRQNRKMYTIANPYGFDGEGRIYFPRWRSWCRSMTPPRVKWRPRIGWQPHRGGGSE